jgi:hypothetical protein
LDKFETTDEVVVQQRDRFAGMEGMSIHVDVRRKRWVTAGPVIAAPNIFPLVSAAGFDS